MNAKPRRDLFSFFANPFVVLADVMVSLVFIISLFLLSTTVYSEQMELIAQRDARRQVMAAALGDELKNSGFVKQAQARGSQLKYQIGNALEVEDDGSIQRFRFLSGLLDFQMDSDHLVHPVEAEKILQAFGRVLLQNRSRIKSIVIEGHATRDERDAWPLSQARAERIRSMWARWGVLADVTEDFNTPIFQFLASHRLWDAKRFHEWHLQEYQARRSTENSRLGVLPAAWVIASGRGDQVRRSPIVEFKIEYTERDAPPLDDYIRSLSPDFLREAREKNLIQ